MDYLHRQRLEPQRLAPGARDSFTYLQSLIEAFMVDLLSESTSASTPAIAATDGERLMRFVRHGDEAAFAEVVETHAAMVWAVCWQILRHRQDE